MEKLPLEITSDILAGLPIVSQLQCRQVCTTWRTLVPKPKMGLLYEVSSTNYFKSKAQFYFSEPNNDNHIHEHLPCFGTLTFDTPRSSVSPALYNFVVCSCNGLICYASLGYRYCSIRGRQFYTCEIRVYICNPVTGEHIQLPAINSCGYSCRRYSNPAIGFGYDKSSNEYKVVVLGHNVTVGRDVQVYTLHLGTQWRSKRCKRENHPLSHLRFLSSVGVLAGGALYWIDEGSIQPNIVAFGLENERFKLLLPTIPSVGHDANPVGLMVLGGSLCVLEVVLGKHVTIWELTNRKAVMSPWVAKFNIAWEDYSWFVPFALAKSDDDECLLWYNAVLSCYDPETRSLKKLDETLRKLMDDSTSLVYSTNRATPHVNSLVSLQAIMEERKASKKSSGGNRMRKTYCY